MKPLLNLIVVIASIYAVSVALSPEYYSNISFLDGVDNVTDVDFGNTSVLQDDKDNNDKEEAADEKQHQQESQDWNQNGWTKLK